MEQALLDQLTIRQLVEDWVVYRDARLWDRFRRVWHPEGRMMATWFQGSYEDFIAMNDAGFANGVRILHMLGGSAIELSASRAIA
ncbi:MAG: nuclear transport factor 2 family protein, partial [Devosia sp.]